MKNGKEMRCGTTHTHQPKTVVVVAVVWMVVVTVGGTGVVLVVVERPAAHHARLPGSPRYADHILEQDGI